MTAFALTPAVDLSHVDAWIFDLDNTLYPASCNLFEQVDRRMGEFIARLLDVDPVEARRVQKTYFRQYGTTLRGLMLEHGLDPAEFLDYVHEIDVTAVPPSPDLRAALARLPGQKIVFTNGSVAHAERILERLGVADQFSGIFDIAAGGYVPKPDPTVYAALLERHGIDPRRAVMVEDLPRNLVPAAALGMTTVLVRTDCEWAQNDPMGEHIHHAVDDLVAWLDAVFPPGCEAVAGQDAAAARGLAAAG